MDDIKLAEIATLVRDELGRALGRVTIDKVHVTEDTSRDGDLILRVAIICRGKPEDIDANALSQVIPLLTSKIENLTSSGFPLLSFLSEADAKKIKLEAA